MQLTMKRNSLNIRGAHTPFDGLATKYPVLAAYICSSHDQKEPQESNRFGLEMLALSPI